MLQNTLPGRAPIVASGRKPHDCCRGAPFVHQGRASAAPRQGRARSVPCGRDGLVDRLASRGRGAGMVLTRERRC